MIYTIIVSKMAVYIGAGLDVRPISIMEHIRKFIYIDSLPVTEWPDMNKDYWQLRTDFIEKLCSKMQAMKFECLTSFSLDTDKPIMIHFKNKKNDVQVDYYMNTPFPSGITKELQQELRKLDTLIIAGHHPHKNIIEMMKKPINIVCWEGTYYGKEECEEDSVIKKLYEDSTLCKSDVASITYYRKQYVKSEFDDIAAVEQFRKSF
jgi:hypothetical protein